MKTRGSWLKLIREPREKDLTEGLNKNSTKFKKLLKMRRVYQPCNLVFLSIKSLSPKIIQRALKTK